MSENLDLVGIGNAIVDVLTQTDDQFIKQNNISKGTMTLIEAEQAEDLYSRMGQAMEMSGGSVANTVAAFASMGGKCGFIGKVANDQLGDVFSHDIQAVGAVYKTPRLSGGLPTARCLIMVTPDAERTMCTFLGASVWITPSDVDRKMVQNAKVTYLEGYLFDRPKAKQAFLAAAEMAHEAGRKVALSLSDPFCVERHRDEFLELIEGHVDILFANKDELMSLFQQETFEFAVKQIQGKCDIAAITQGPKGAIIVTPNERYEVAAEKIDRVVDTTGAGDLYAAGFLFGYTRGEPLEICGRYGSIAAGEVIRHMGARVQGDLGDLLQKQKVVYG